MPHRAVELCLALWRIALLVRQATSAMLQCVLNVNHVRDSFKSRFYMRLTGNVAAQCVVMSEDLKLIQRATVVPMLPNLCMRFSPEVQGT